LDAAERVEEEADAGEQHDDKGMEIAVKAFTTADVGAAAIAAEAEARIETIIKERKDVWSETLLQEQEKVRAKAERALDLAEESSRACLIVAKQLQDAGDSPLCTQSQVQTLIQQGLDALQFKKPHSRCSEGDQADVTTQVVFNDGNTSPRTVAAVMDDLHQRLEEWVSAIEGRVCAVEHTLWSLNLGAERHGPDLPPADSEVEALQPKSRATIPKQQVEVNSGGAVVVEGKSLADVKRELATIKDSVKVQAARLELLQRDACSPCKKVLEERQTRGSSVLSVASDGRGHTMHQVFTRRGVSVDIRAAKAVSAPSSRVPETVQLEPILRQPQATHTHTAQLRRCSEDGGLSLRSNERGLSVRASPLAERRTVQRRSSAPVFPPSAGWRWGMVSMPTSRQVSPNSHAMRFSPIQERPASAFPPARRQHTNVSPGINCWSPGSAAASVELSVR